MSTRIKARRLVGLARSAGPTARLRGGRAREREPSRPSPRTQSANSRHSREHLPDVVQVYIIGLGACPGRGVIRRLIAVLIGPALQACPVTVTSAQSAAPAPGGQMTWAVHLTPRWLDPADNARPHP